MVDIHSHILFDFDDGPPSKDESMMMLKMAADNGTTDIFITPHFLNPNKVPSDVTSKDVFKRYKELNDELKLQNIDINIHPGAEILGYPNIFHILPPESLITLGDSNYVLLEFGFDESFYDSMMTANKVIQAGYRLIIAHPERYAFMNEDPSLIIQFLKRGCLLQLNKGSVSGKFGSRVSKAAKYLLENHYVHFVASDTHRLFHRTPSLMGEYNRISASYGPAYADAIFTQNGLKLLSGEKIKRFET